MTARAATTGGMLKQYLYVMVKYAVVGKLGGKRESERECERERERKSETDRHRQSHR